MFIVYSRRNLKSQIKMELNPLILLLLLLCFCHTVTPRKQREVLQELLNQTTYDINEWPHASQGRRTDVSVQLFINSFGSLNAANMDYSLDTFLRQRWEDPRLTYAAGSTDLKSITITDSTMRAKVWKPDTFFENVKDASLHQVTMPNVLLRIYPDGKILYSLRIKAKLACNLKLEHYPLDSQLCLVALASYANTLDVIKYHWEEKNPIDIPDNLEISQFDLLANKTEQKTYSYVTGNYSGLHAYFSLRRQNGYHVLQTYIPTILIVSISWVSFWLDPNAIPGRVTLGVTTLLTLTTLAAGIRQQLPPVSYVKAIDVWIGMCMIMVFGALLEFTFVNWLANRKIPPGRIPCSIPKCLMVCSVAASEEEEDKEVGADNGPKPPPKPTTYINHARAFDRVCRVMFPASFLFFNLAYWPFYLSQQYNTLI